MTSRRGQLLLAGTQLVDPNFVQTVTVLVEHNDQGAMGLVLNRPTKTTVAQAWAQVDVDTPCLQDGFLYHGGPCAGPLMLLHTDRDHGQIQVTDGIFYTNDAEDVQWLVEHHRDAIKCFVGYAGWGPGQLEAELDAESWIVAPATASEVFDAAPQQWFDLLSAINPAQAAIMRNPKIVPPDPSVN